MKNEKKYLTEMIIVSVVAIVGAPIVINRVAKLFPKINAQNTVKFDIESDEWGPEIVPSEKKGNEDGQV